MIKAVAICLLGYMLTLPVLAEEKVHWKARGAFAITSGKSVKIADRPDHSVGVDEYDGVVFSQGETPFLDNARYQVVSLYDSGVGATGYKTFTVQDGSILAEYKTTGGSWPRFLGEWTVISGTGRYKGIAGKGSFDATYVSDTAAWDIFEGDFTLP